MKFNELKVVLENIGANPYKCSLDQNYGTSEVGVCLVQNGSSFKIWNWDSGKRWLFHEFDNESEACEVFCSIVEKDKYYTMHSAGVFDNDKAAMHLVQKFNEAGILAEIISFQIGFERKKCFEVQVFGRDFLKIKTIRGY